VSGRDFEVHKNQQQQIVFANESNFSFESGASKELIRVQFNLNCCMGVATESKDQQHR